jgi:amylosucrase
MQTIRRAFSPLGHLKFKAVSIQLPAEHLKKLGGIMAKLESAAAAQSPSPTDQRIFELRWRRSEADLMEPLRLIYGKHRKFDEFVNDLKALLLGHWAARPADLKDLDLQRDFNPDWFQSEQMAGYVFYIDRFSGKLIKVLDHLDHLKALGANYIHFMPCLEPRPGDSDGGYSVKNYREINPALGTMADLEKVTKALRTEGMSVCIDLVLNHTAKEHEWAEKAKKGDKKYQAYYWMFDKDTVPKQYEETLVEIFPAHAPGSFTYYPAFKKWVWTTFNEHQWDLNWSNPDVFLEIVDIMLNLANKGADVLRLDAVAFMWKRMGTNCQNQSEVHDLLQALRAATRIAAPALIHKAEAIVSPRDLVPYLGVGRHTGREANIAYHNNLMVQYWSSLASRDTTMMNHVMASHFPHVIRNACWGAYIRCHDDIGWAITDEDAAAIPHFSAPGHRKFLADFYSGRFAGSFARGGIFQENALTGDRRNSGSFASLAGLEEALDTGDQKSITLAVDRILMGHALIASFGGVPLLYMGDEIGMLNDYSYVDEPSHAHDNRWMHRPRMDWAVVKSLEKSRTPQAWIFQGVKHIIARRKAVPAFSAKHPTRILHTGNSRLFGFARDGDAETVVCLFNFSEIPQAITEGQLRAMGAAQFHDRLADAAADRNGGFVHILPYGRVWLA